MAKRRKPGRRPTGLTVRVNFMMTPHDRRELARFALDYPSEADVIRSALTAFFSSRNVRNTDTIVYSAGQPEQQVA